VPFAEFGQRYLDAHRCSGTRAAHYVATLWGAASAVVAIHQTDPSYLARGILLSVAVAVGSHWLIERNRPLILVNPLYGAVANLRMCWLGLTGGLDGEYKRCLSKAASSAPNNG